MKLSEAAQERLEQLWMMTEENATEDFAVAAEVEQELVQRGLLAEAGRRTALTASGKQEAAAAIRRHRLAERLLADVLVTEEAALDERACGLEHALFDGVDESICTLLGHPQFCPHGKPIPPGACCQQNRSSVQRLIAPLCELKPGQAGKIAYIQMNDSQRLQKVMAMGILPGVEVKLNRDYPSFVFEAGYSQFAVDEDIAADIYVRLNAGSVK